MPNSECTLRVDPPYVSFAEKVFATYRRHIQSAIRGKCHSTYLSKEYVSIAALYARRRRL